MLYLLAFIDDCLFIQSHR